MIGLLLIMYDVVNVDVDEVIACIAVDIAVHVAATFVLYWLILLLLMLLLVLLMGQRHDSRDDVCCDAGVYCLIDVDKLLMFTWMVLCL